MRKQRPWYGWIFDFVMTVLSHGIWIIWIIIRELIRSR